MKETNKNVQVLFKYFYTLLISEQNINTGQEIK